MYKLGKNQFECFKHTPGHRSNYAILNKAGDWKYGMKYSPIYGFTDEYEVLNYLSHPQIPMCYDFGRERLFERNKFIFEEYYIVMQHFEGDDILKYYKRKKIARYSVINNIVKHFLDFAELLKYIHSLGFIHTDIKPGHLILNPSTGMIGLIDLELAIKKGENIKGISWEYASPEQKQMAKRLRDHQEHVAEKEIFSMPSIDEKTDLYSIGLILYEILTGKLWKYIRQSPIKHNKFIPQKLNEIVMGLLEKNQSCRIPMAETLIEELMHV